MNGQSSLVLLMGSELLMPYNLPKMGNWLLLYIIIYLNIVFS